MTKDERKVLRELLAKATPGPWKVDHNEHIGSKWISWEVQSEPGVYIWSNGEDYSGVSDEADGRLIATARNSLPALLDALEAAERERDDWKETAGRMSDRASKDWGRAKDAESRAATARAEALEEAAVLVESNPRIWYLREVPSAIRALIPTKETP